MQYFTDDFIQAIPKTDLHVHLDGSLRIGTLIDLAKASGVSLPAMDEAGLRKTVFKDSYQNLEEYLAGFAYTTAVLRSRDALYRVSYELFMDNAAEGVRYLEVRFAPQLLMSETLSFQDVMEAVDQGLRDARDKLNRHRPSNEPAYDYGIIACAMRFFTKDFSPYYRDYSRMHEFSSPTEIISGASLELAKAVVQLRAHSSIQIVGFDLAGAEYGYPASDHQASYELVEKGFLHKTVHAGEAFGPESIFQAVTKLQADRIGHGLHLFDVDLIRSSHEQDPETYVKELVNYIANRRITVEVCLTSNMQTTPDLKSLEQHSFRRMLEQKLSVTLCTDNRLVSNTSLCKEYRLALDTFPITAHDLKNMIAYGFKRSFYYHPYPQKRAWVRSVLDYYDRIARQFGIRE
ncbi:adenosine deaminase family protein [Gracilinema caldarium]|uniref:adenosine deaminase n=1 Tax=Gracilinema caldarium (strain ATCC 51460 / DSM 7334 / H1) TaxID=744872 RepID=F8EYL0_GRAC1|nr:adenosine deaminase family protein [Gracilinema caldarium]AEJ18587.1 Adenosine deaminase [Gracilinema caldarium DSM 7334]